MKIQTFGPSENKCHGLSFKYDAEQGIVSGYAAVYGNVDDGGDVIVNGAGAKTITENLDRVKLKLQHGKGLPLSIGKVTFLKELGKNELPIDLITKYPTVTGALYFEAKISDTTDGRDAKELIKDKVLTECSIGYDAIKPERKNAIRYIKEYRLWEISLVDWGMNSATRVTGFKSKGGNDVETLLEQVMETKAADLITSMNQAVKLQQLREQRWKLSDALWDVTNNIMNDTEMDGPAKVTAMTENLDQFKELMLAWFTAYIALANATNPGKSIEFDMEQKAGRTLSKRTRGALQGAVDAISALLEAADEPEEEPTSKARKPGADSTLGDDGAAGNGIDDEVKSVLDEIQNFKNKELKL